MRILLLGANGFIGSHVLGRLLSDPHQVRAAVRDPARLKLQFPDVEAVRADLNRMLRPADWRPLLEGVDAVINCAGALQSASGQSLRAVHLEAPMALYRACLDAKVRRVLHISAISADPEAGTEYARTKHAAEEALKALDLDWTILRPSLVYGDRSYGGTSLLRALAAMPGFIPLPGRGDQPFQPIHLDDLAETVSLVLREPRFARTVLEPVGPQRLTTAEIATLLRAWLGLGPARILPVPLPLVRAAARLGDLVGAGPLRTTAVEQLLHGNAGDPAPFTEATGIRPRRMADALRSRPAGVQDVWHARLFFLRPLLRAGLALFWIWTGLAVLLWMPRGEGDALFLAAGVPEALIPPAWIAGGLVDLALGLWLLFARGVAPVGAAMLAVSAVYLAVLTVAAPELWLEPLGGLAKTPIVMLGTLALMAIAEER
ncbi:MAG TPA: NAD(P)H-binding protein [Alphaproteobacteria bacterium]